MHSSKSSLPNLLALALLGLVASPVEANEPIDLDVGFGANGIAYLPVDASNSSNRDRTVAVFQNGFTDYVVVAETANAAGGVSPTFVRAGPNGALTRNTVNFNALGVTAACQDSVSGDFVIAMRNANSGGNSITFRKSISKS